MIVDVHFSYRLSNDFVCFFYSSLLLERYRHWHGVVRPSWWQAEGESVLFELLPTWMHHHSRHAVLRQLELFVPMGKWPIDYLACQTLFTMEQKSNYVDRTVFAAIRWLQCIAMTTYLGMWDCWFIAKKQFNSFLLNVKVTKQEKLS